MPMPPPIYGFISFRNKQKTNNRDGGLMNSIPPGPLVRGVATNLVDSPVFCPFALGGTPQSIIRRFSHGMKQCKGWTINDPVTLPYPYYANRQGLWAFEIALLWLTEEQASNALGEKRVISTISGEENSKFAKTSSLSALTILTKSRQLVDERQGFTNSAECSGSCIISICR